MFTWLCNFFFLLQELQHSQRLERLREEQQAVRDKLTQKQQFEQNFKPCIVCGDKASGKWMRKMLWTGLFSINSFKYYCILISFFWGFFFLDEKLFIKTNIPIFIAFLSHCFSFTWMSCILEYLTLCEVIVSNTQIIQSVGQA